MIEGDGWETVYSSPPVSDRRAVPCIHVYRTAAGSELSCELLQGHVGPHSWAWHARPHSFGSWDCDELLGEFGYATRRLR